MPRQSYEFAELDKEIFLLLKKFGYEPTIIFDVGASTGFWSHHIAEIFPQATFHLFEPLVDHVPEYASSMALNLASHPAFVLHKLALSASSGEIAFNVFPSPTASTSLDVAAGLPGVRPLRVPSMTLEDVVLTRALPVPQVVKVDVQGGELAVLQGARSILPEIDVLLLECWTWRGYGPRTPLVGEIVAWLAKAGFSLWDVGDSYRDPDGVLASVDCVFVNVRTMVRHLAYRVGMPESGPPCADMPKLATAMDGLSSELLHDTRDERDRLAGQLRGARADVDRLIRITERLMLDADTGRGRLLDELRDARADVVRLTGTMEQLQRDGRAERESLLEELGKAVANAARLAEVVDQLQREGHAERESLLGQLERAWADADRLTGVVEQLQRDGEAERASLLGELESARATADRALEERARLSERVAAHEGRIRAMESSKFWKLRTWWFTVKRRLGLTDE
jgi:FkbM family methyltransferase